MTTITSEDRIAIAELFARYCHCVDHADTVGWLELFTPDGTFEVAGVMRLEGHEQVAAMPAVVAQQGGGKWRHQITNIVVDTADAAGTALVSAYGLVTDWGDMGKPMTFSDYAITLNRVEGAWRIRSLVATAP
ncbi:nuclear transport factor 2 family protein [Novosphingobium sp. CCH12-A3]|uniref:nuclear transport factor 2 family protein n=1 Tax=Novosphingobium sp. CCH12-A3 TaxID=1768752 RepID=UPI000A642438|nr:nuclear transport factor 2 family protein [Novosphingobium sp. CCH12-A3]